MVGWLVENELKKAQKQQFWINLKCYVSMCLEGLKEINRNLRDYSRCLGQIWIRFLPNSKHKRYPLRRNFWNE